MKRILFTTLLLLLTATLTSAQSYIPDLAPVDVYGNLESKGFSVEKDLGSEYGNFWTCTLSANSINYRVEINSKDVNRVQSIRATVRNANYNHSEAKQFLKYVASVLFFEDKSGQSRLNSWIDDNYDSGEATTSVGSVDIKLSAPSMAMKMLTIDSNLNDGM